MSRSTFDLPQPVADILRAIKVLERTYPQRKFTLDGHLLGSLGEVIAAEKFGLTLHKMSERGMDAFDSEGKPVEIKITGGKQVAMYGPCRTLIALRLLPPDKVEVVYHGPGEPAWNAVAFDKEGKERKLPKNGQRRISLSRLEAIARGTA